MNVLRLYKKMQKNYLYSFSPDIAIFEINISRFHDPFRNICCDIESSIHDYD